MPRCFHSTSSPAQASMLRSSRNRSRQASSRVAPSQACASSCSTRRWGPASISSRTHRSTRPPARSRGTLGSHRCRCGSASRSAAARDRQPRNALRPRRRAPSPPAENPPRRPVACRHRISVPRQRDGVGQARDRADAHRDHYPTGGPRVPCVHGPTVGLSALGTAHERLDPVGTGLELSSLGVPFGLQRERGTVRPCASSCWARWRSRRHPNPSRSAAASRSLSSPTCCAAPTVGCRQRR